MFVRARECQPKAIVGISRDDVDVEVGDILESHLPIGDEKVDPAGAEGLAGDGGQLARDAERAHGAGLVDV